MRLHPKTTKVSCRPLAPIKLTRLRLRTFRPDSRSPNACGAIDRVVFITVARIDALKTDPRCLPPSNATTAAK